jgi:hypothetical protein
MAPKRTWTEAWSGEKKCQTCPRKAYYYQKGKVASEVFCGYHLEKSIRENLPKNPDAKKRREDAWQRAQEAATEKALMSSKPGSVRMKRLLMMRTPPEAAAGVLRVAPNYKPTTLALHLPGLSPKSMGPIVHGCAELPVAASLENLHQGRKIFHRDIDENGEITAEAWAYMKAFVADSIPHRHKYSGKDLPKDNKNVPLYSIAFSKTGELRKYSYLESRLFYIRWYEHFCCESLDFLDLCAKVQSGYDIEIVGYDSIEGPVNAGSMLAAYRDASRPFGHEAVLSCLLMGLKPWAVDKDLPMYRDMFPDSLKEV